MALDLETGIESQAGMRVAIAVPSSLKDKAHQFSETVSLVGLRHATDGRSSMCRRILWMMWILVGIGLAFYQILDCVVRYGNNSCTTEFEMVSAQELRLPQVTLCNEYMIMKSKAKELGIYDYMRNLSQIGMSSTTEDMVDLSAQVMENVIKLGAATKDWEKVSEELSQSATEAIKSFKWSEQHLNLKKVIRSKTDMGHCFGISSVNHPLISTSAGMKYGLRLELDAEPSEYFPTVQYDTEMSGFRVLIHDPLEVPRMRDAGFTVSPGNVVRVAISLENISYPGPPHGNCIDDPEYRMMNCIAKCEDAFYAKECGCKPYYAHGDIRVCSFLEQDECDSEMGHTRRQDPAGAACNCPQECNRRIYKHFTSQSQLTQKTLFSWDTKDATDSTKIVLHVYYQHLTYMQIDSVPAYSFLRLLCEVGGALSLLLGATLLTVYEIVEFVVDVARHYFNQRLISSTKAPSAAIDNWSQSKA